jgi:antitoxin YefM
MGIVSASLPASKARSNFYTILEEVAGKLKRFTITRRGKAQAVVMHPDEVAAWEETMDILADKKLVTQILKSELERRRGEGVTEKKLLRELGLSKEDVESA